MSKTNHLQIITFGLQRTASPYRSIQMCQYQKARTSFDHLVGTHEQR